MRIITLVALLIFFVGCASFGSAEKKGDNYISNRAVQRWNALIAKDYKVAYEYQSPGYRKAKSLDFYSRQFGSWVKWTGVSVQKVHRISDEVAEVDIQLEFEIFQKWSESLQKRTSNFSEKWIYAEGDWWIVSN